ncbi:MAG: DMT family transporter [Spirochaetia bacterium]|jgi:drug/metabolite transporter (DMT)-like permease|nr:DMT family transporter [Spirochaetia bacterium]
MKATGKLKTDPKAEIYALSAVLLWSTVATAFKIALKTLTYEELLFYSLPASIGAIALILTKQKMWKNVFISDVFYKSLIFGFFNPFLYYLVLFKAYEILPAQKAQPLNYTWAVVLVILSSFILKQKLKLKDITSVIISFSGAAIIVTGGSFSAFMADEIPGVLLALGSAFIWASYWLFTKKDKTEASVKLFGSFAAGLFYITVYMMFKNSFQPRSFIEIVPALYVGLFEMGITFFLWSRALHLAENTAKIGNLIYLSPFLSFIFINLILKESIRLSSVAGLLLITAGILMGRKG